MSNMKNTAKKSSSKESPTVFWMPPPSLGTSESLSPTVTPQAIREWLTLSLGDSPASPSRSPASSLENQTLEICGLQPLSAFASYDHGSRSWKTSQGCLGTNTLDEYSEIWPNAVIVCGAECFQDTALVRLLTVKDCSFWPRPTASMGKRGWGLSRTGRLRYNENLIERCFAKCGYKPSSETLEVIMGWPIMWTAAKPSETAKFHSKWLTPFRSYLATLLND